MKGGCWWRSPTQQGQAGVSRQPAITLQPRSLRRSETTPATEGSRRCASLAVLTPNPAPKLEAQLSMDSPGRTRSSCEQVPAYYTSMRSSANQRETVWHCEVPDALKGRGCKTSNTLGQEAPKRHDLSRWPSKTISRGPAGPRYQQSATRRQQPVSTT